MDFVWAYDKAVYQVRVWVKAFTWDSEQSEGKEEESAAP